MNELPSLGDTQKPNGSERPERSENGKIEREKTNAVVWAAPCTTSLLRLARQKRGG